MREFKVKNGFTLLELLVIILVVGILLLVLIPTLLSSRQITYNASALSCGKSIQIAQAIFQIDNKSYMMLGNNKDQLNVGVDGINPICNDKNIFLAERTGGEKIIFDYVIDIWDRRGSKVYTITPKLLKADVIGATSFSSTGEGGSNLP